MLSVTIFNNELKKEKYMKVNNKVITFGITLIERI